MRKRIAKKLVSYLVMAAVLMTSALNINPEQMAEAATKVKVTLKNPSISTLTLKKGEKFKLGVTVSPARRKKEVRYVSSNKKIVKVSRKGVLKAVKKGKAAIHILDKSGKKMKSIQVRVVKKLVKVKKVKLNKTKVTVEKGKSVSLKATVSPKKATDKKVAFLSSNEKIATVNRKGKVVGKGAGTAMIYAYAKDGRGAKASCKVRVKAEEKTNVQAPSEHVDDEQKPSSNPTGEPGTTVKPETTSKPEVTAAPGQTTHPAFAEVEKTTEDIPLFSESSRPAIYIDEEAEDAKGLNLIAESFEEDIALISGEKGDVIHDLADSTQTTIIAGVVGDSDVIDSYVEAGVLDVSDVTGKWETYKICTLKDKANAGKNAIVVAGSDKRGVIYGIYYISELMGVSPWSYWGDVLPVQKSSLTLPNSEINFTSKEPSVKYRGIFLNDEAPSLSGWVKQAYGGYNEKFYAKMYELILRLKGNYLWPAMWSNCFSKDGTDEEGIANAELADVYGIVMGTSHHEPLCRAGNEWNDSYKSYVKPEEIVPGEGSSYYWNYDLFPEELTAFWDDGVKRNKAFENVYTIGMRGEADSAIDLSVDTFKKIITTQKNILTENGLADAPNVLVLYKEIEKLWYDGDGSGESIADWSGLDDTTIMLCEDNFGNMRTLPAAENRNRAAGWGMYYHFDYHGSPRSYEWIDTVPLQKTWEQMSMAYDYGVDDIWIVNVGDLKPMEMSTSYFLDMAYDFDRWGTNNKNSADEYTENWVKQQFGNELSETEISDVASIMTEYLNINGSRKPEIVLSNTYSVSNFNEAMNMLRRCQNLIDKAEGYMDSMSESQKAAFFQLVYYPAAAAANVNQMQIYAALNEYFYNQKSAAANLYGTLINKAVAFDEQLSDTYNKNMYQAGDKWRYMMSSPHVGFTHWNSADWTYPEPKWVTTKAKSSLKVTLENDETTYSEGSCTLSDFTSTNQESYAITLSNGGGKSYAYQVETDADWIVCSKTEGTVFLQDMFSVRVDWSKVTETKTGTITITGAGQSVVIHVTANVTDISELAEKTYVEEHGYISVDVSNYTDKKAGANGEAFEILNNYGKSKVAAKVYPTTAAFDTYKDAPYLEYKIHAAKDGEYTIQAYVAPSNNVDWNKITMRYGVSVDGGEVTTVDTLDGENFQAGNHTGTNNTWSKNVMENIRIASSKQNLTAGTHTIRFYAKDPALVLEKLVIYSGELKESYFGPEESYYVGKTGTSDTYIPEFDDVKYNLPGSVPAAGYEGSQDTFADTITGKEKDEFNYPVILTADGMYAYKLDAGADSNGEVELLLDGKTLGTVRVSGEGIYEVTEKDGYSGEGMLSLVVKSGTVTISSIRAAKKNTTIGYPVYLSSSSGEAERAYDKNEDTVWTPAEEDLADGTSFVTVDFKDNYTVDHFTLSGQGNGITSYEVQLYNGRNFETIYTGDDIQDGQAVYIQGKTVYSGSEMRVVFHGGKPEISELSVTPYINWALADDTEISGTDKNGLSCSIPSSIADGNRITNALESSTMGSGSEIIMSFSKARPVNAVNIISLQQAEKDEAGSGTIPDEAMTTELAQTTYTAYYYYGGKWNIGGSVSQPDAAKRKVLNSIVFSHEVMAEAVKVVVTTSYWVRIVEMEPVFDYENSVSSLITEQGLENGTNTVSWEEEKAVGRIQVVGEVNPSDFKVTYTDKNTGNITELTDYDIWEEKDGFSILPIEQAVVNNLLISSTQTAGAVVRVWQKLPEKTASNKTVLHEETFEKGIGSMISWANATVETTKQQSYRGNKSLLVTGRNADYSTMALNLTNIVGAEDNITEYTLSYYVKSASGDLNIRNSICNLQGNNLDEDNGKIIAISDSDWIRVEYKFSMKTKDFRYFKIETIGDKAGSNGNYTDFYVDDLKISLTGAPCTCGINSAPEFTITNNDFVIPKEKNSLSVNLQAACDVSTGSCLAGGHSEGEVSYHYSLLYSDCSDASIAKGKLNVSLGDETTGIVIVKVTASLNGKTRSSAKKFEVTKSDEYGEGYMNYALASNGGTITASAGENNSTALPRLIDGDYVNRWRTNTLPAYIEIRFDGLIDVSKIGIYGQEDSNLPIKAYTVSYMQDGEWKEFTNGSMSDNAEMYSEFQWGESVKTPAVRIDIPKTATASSDGWVRFTEIEVWGTKHTSDGACECQLGTPVYTGTADVVIEKNEIETTIDLSAASIYSVAGCTQQSCTDTEPAYSYEIISDADNIASINETKLTLKNTEAYSNVVVGITAALNGIVKKSEQTILVRNGGYENYALSSNGATITATSAESDAVNLLDGDRSFRNGKRWRTNTYPTTVDVTFAGEYTLSQIDLFTQQDAATAEPTKAMVNKASMAVSKLNLYYWDASLNGGAGDWAMFANGAIADNNKVWIQCKEAVTTSKIRVEFPEKVADSWARLVEIQAWGEKADVDMEALKTIDLSQFASKDGTGTGSYDSETGALTFTYSAAKERLYFPLSAELIAEIAKGDVSAEQVKITVDATIDSDNISFDTALMGLGNSNWNGTVLGNWTWGTATETPIEKVVGFNENAATSENFAYVMLRMKTTGATPTVTIRKITVELVK